MSYFILKLIHILSATVMIGTGFGSAFYLYFTYKNTQASTVRDVLKFVIIADKIFTLPSVIIQLITGWLLADLMSMLFTVWFWVVICVSAVVLLLWIKAAFIQIKLRKIILEENEISKRFHRGMTEWFWLGIFSFLGAIYLYYLMVYKPFLYK